MENVKIEENTYIKIFKGLLISFVVTLIGITIFSLILTYTNIPESTIPIVIIAISFISILIGATISTRKTSKNGMINGGLVGGMYIVILYLISSIVSVGFSINIYTTFMIILGIIAGFIGRYYWYKFIEKVKKYFSKFFKNEL